jgi:DNA-binding MarR family transcriptional regulator
MDTSMNEETTKNDQTFRKLMDVQHVMMALHHRKMFEHGPLGDTTRGRGRILALLQLKDGIATKDMAQILGIRVSSLNETLGKLERDGYIERTPSEEDKRIMLVTLTEKGREVKPHGSRLPKKLFAGFSDEELDAFSGYLDRMMANLEEELGEDAQVVLEQMREKRAKFLEMHGHGFHHGHGRGRCGHSHEGQ